MSRNNYFYVLHHNPHGRETAACKFGNKEAALTALANEVGQSLTFVEVGVCSSSHTLKRFANAADRPAELLETFLATNGDWGETDFPRRPAGTTIIVKRKRPD
jgi:phosphopantetheinyl transferase (holo-ACP synthase)